MDYEMRRTEKKSSINSGGMQELRLRGTDESISGKPKKREIAVKKRVSELIMETVIEDGGKSVSPSKVSKLDLMVAHAQVVLVKKLGKRYINLCVRPTHMELLEVMYAALDHEGKRQMDPPPLKPRARELKQKLNEKKKENKE